MRVLRWTPAPLRLGVLAGVAALALVTPAASRRGAPIRRRSPPAR